MARRSLRSSSYTWPDTQGWWDSARRTLAAIPAPYRNGAPWLSALGSTPQVLRTTALDDAQTACRLVFPDGRVLLICAQPDGVEVYPGYICPPGWDGPHAEPLRACVDTWSTWIAPWGKLTPHAIAHRALQSRKAHTTHTTTLVLNNTIGSITITHPLWSAIVDWQKAGDILLRLDTALPRETDAMLHWIWNGQELAPIALALRQGRPRLSRLMEEGWPLLSPLTAWWWRRRPLVWLGNPTP